LFAEIRLQAGAAAEYHLGPIRRVPMDSSLAYSVAEACEVGNTGRTALYEAIRTGELRAVKRGRRTLILADDLRAWLENLPAVEPNRRVPQGPVTGHILRKKQWES
jgi:excisionase family DNA binding protein